MTRSRITSVVAIGAVAVGMLAGCGGDDEQQPKGTDLTAVRCPLVAKGQGPDGTPKYEPAENAFDTAELIGMTLEDARARAGEQGCEVVVSLEDGKGKPVPIDVDPRRIYVYTEKGRVTQIEGVGGGL